MLRYRTGAHFSHGLQCLPSTFPRSSLALEANFSPTGAVLWMSLLCLFQRDKSLIKIEFKLFSLVLIMAVSSVVNTFYISAVF